LKFIFLNIYYKTIKYIKRNTFQLTILSNGNHTFAIFNYEEITWYAATSQGGNPETGTGGKAARVNFNKKKLNYLFLIIIINWIRLDLIEEMELYGMDINLFQKMLNLCKLWTDTQT
jgi:hypothetical protein